jgi:chaperonin cofactor prefoldin
VYEIRKTAQDKKEEFNKHMETLRKKESNTNCQNKKFKSNLQKTVESHCSRLAQVEDRISGPKTKKIYMKMQKNT